MTKKSKAKGRSTSKKSTSKKGAAKKGMNPKRVTRGAANSAFMKPLQPSESLAKVVGNKPLPRTEAVKKIWAYIRKNKLQDQKNKRNINADENLKAVFGGKKVVNMFEMTRLLNKNLSK